MPLLHPLVELGWWPVAAPSAVVHTRKQALAPSGGNILPSGQGLRRLAISSIWTRPWPVARTRGSKAAKAAMDRCAAAQSQVL